MNAPDAAMAPAGGHEEAVAGKKRKAESTAHSVEGEAPEGPEVAKRPRDGGPEQPGGPIAVLGERT